MFKLLITLFFLSPLYLFAQNRNSQTPDTSVVKNIAEKLKIYTRNNYSEKVYLHFDKPYYAAGDTLYFKAYVTNVLDHILSENSGILHVDLIIDKKIQQSIKLPLIGGIAWGDFALSDSLKQDNYQIRAYTNLMRNQGADDFLDKRIFIGSSKKANTKSSLVKTQSNHFSVQFFPEGGSLVNNLRSKLAFKALDNNGLSINIKGDIFDDQGKKIAAIITQHAGMGSIFITPEENRAYIAKLIYPDGSRGDVNLPVAKSDGYVLGVYNNPTDTNIIVKVAASVATFQRDQNTDITIISQSGGRIVYAAKSKLESALFIISIPRSRFKTGIAQFTLFSASGEPLNERVIFVQNPASLSLSLDTKKHIYAPREKVIVNVSANTLNNAEGTGSYSVAVTDETKVPIDDDYENSILANLLLTSDIKGYVEKPNYYFNHINDTTKADLDLLMLTQGYRRFEWKKILADNQSSLTFKPEAGMDITGQVKTFTGKPVPNAKVTLISKGTVALLLDTVTNEHGVFIFHDVYFVDSVRF